MKKLSQTARRLVGQPMFKLLAKIEQMEKEGQSVFHFEIGDSDFKAHQHIVEATKAALDNDETHYVNSMGIRALREAVCEYTQQTLGFKPALEQVLIMPANGVIDCVMRTVASDPGDEVIYPDPGFSTYIAVMNYTGIKEVCVPLREENDFHLEAGEIARRMTDQTRLLIMNSPQNPTGAVLNEKEIDDIALLAKDRDVYLLSDEIYSRVLYQGTHYSPGALDRCQERTIILNGFAKGFSMPGWRLGYAIGPEEVIGKMGLLFQTMYSCLPPFIQQGGICALKGNQDVIEARIRQFKLLRDLMVKKLNEIPGVSCRTPAGACYVFANIKATGMTSVQFANFVLEKAGVALLPGSCFGQLGEGYVRLCFTRRPEVIEEACEKMKTVIQEEGSYAVSRH